MIIYLDILFYKNNERIRIYLMFITILLNSLPNIFVLKNMITSSFNEKGVYELDLIGVDFFHTLVQQKKIK